MRPPTRLLARPRLRGLARDEVRSGTWRLGVASVRATWGWLALGAVLVALQELEALSRISTGRLALAWMLASSLVGALGAGAQLAVLRDGARLRSRGWRARGVLLVTGLFGLSVAILGLAAWILRHRSG